MLKDDLLYLVGRDVLATPPNRVLLAINEINVAVLVHVATVAGVEPQVAEGAPGRLGHVVVALGVDPRLHRAYHDLTRLAARQLEVIVVHDADLDVLAGLAAGGPLSRRVIRAARSDHAAVGQR